MAVSEFRIVPDGIHPLLIGMDREQIDRMMGEVPKPDISRRPNEEALRYENAHARVVMRDRRAVEISLVPPAKVLFDGKPLFGSSSVWRDLVVEDGDAREVVGFIVLPRLKLALTGFHDGGTEQPSISAFEGGRWDALNSAMKPFAL